MRKVCFYLGTGFHGGEYKEIMEFPDGTTNEEIQDEYEYWKSEKLDESWWDEE